MSLTSTLLLNDRLRRHWVNLRLFYYARLLGRLRTLEADRSDPETVRHNLKSLRAGNTRMHRLLRPLTALEMLDENSKVLLIGPRNEADLWLLAGYGFSIENLRGLDIISYSPLIDLGDMHETPYTDNQWDAVVLGWVLSYSIDPGRLANEVVRIVKPGGIVAIGVEYSTLTPDDVSGLVGYRLGKDERINSVAQILELFGSTLGHVYYSHDAPLKRSHTKSGFIANPSAVCAIFSVNKPGSA